MRSLRWLAALLIRGPHAAHIRDDLDQALSRDLERGLSIRRARWRYLVNVLTSAVVLGRDRLWRIAQRVSIPGVSLIDLKLAVRMLFKHPGLTAVAVFALALGIPAALWPFQMMNVFGTPLPLDDGERIVGIRHVRIAERNMSPGSFHEYELWREALSSFAPVGAAKSDLYNVIADNGLVAPWRGAQMSASSFEVAGVRPLLGRALRSEDEVPGAPDVVVISYRLWQSVFAGDTGVLGRTLQLGGDAHTVVGVMPDGFYFPVNDHVWVPLRGTASGFEAGETSGLWIYGRLAPGVSEKQATAELAGIERGLDDAFPALYAPLRPELVPFTHLITGMQREEMWILLPFQLVAVVLLGVACGNVGTMILARTATRSGEVAVRTALGASRARIVSQLFVESLVLALVATGLGMLLAELVADQFARTASGVWSDFLPFWIDFGPSRRTVLQAMALAVFSAVVAGVLPALKATGRGIQGNLQRAAGGRSGIRFGRATTVLVVAEVALGVTCLFASTLGYRMVPRMYLPPNQIPTEQFLSARVRLEKRPPAEIPEAERARQQERLASFQRELRRRLEAEPGVRGVALADVLPGDLHDGVGLEVEGTSTNHPSDLHWVKRASVDVGFFDGLGATIRNGRDFAVSDLPARTDQPSTAVIVNAAFLEDVLHGGNPVGRRLRYARDAGQEPAPWLEIVGVVGDLGMLDPDGGETYGGIYQPILPGVYDPIEIAVRVGEQPMAFLPRLRAIAAGIEPLAVVEEAQPLNEILSENRLLIGWLFFGVAVVAGVAVLLSIASLYALMSFTVAQRTPEIGLRSALGASAGNIVTVIAKRALTQLMVGVSISVVACMVVMVAALNPERVPASWPGLLAAAAGVVLLIGLLACVVPTRRGIRIRPMDAMRT